MRERTERTLKLVGEYQLTRTIGLGSTGKVKLAIHTLTGARVCTALLKLITQRACKIMELPDCLLPIQPNACDITINSFLDLHKFPRMQAGVDTPGYRQDVDKAERILREITVMLLLDHPHIVALNQVHIISGFIYLIFDLVAGGQMLDHIISYGRLRQKQARAYMRQLVSALTYCHLNSIVHRDLKIENVMLLGEGTACCIVDFGLANITGDHLLTTFCGSLYFAAPELLRGIPYEGPEVEVWSLGVVLFVLLTGRVPFDDTSVPKLHAKIKSGDYSLPSHISSECRDLLARMICVDRKKRITLEEVRTSQWMNRGFSTMQSSFLPKRGLIEEFDRDIMAKIKTLVSFRKLPFKLAQLVTIEAQQQSPYMSIYWLIKEKQEHLNIHTKLSELTLFNTSDYSLTSTSLAVSQHRPRKGSENAQNRNDRAAPLDPDQPLSRSYSAPARSFLSQLALNTKRRFSRQLQPIEELTPMPQDRADIQIETVGLTRLFSVKSTSRKTPSEIRAELVRVLSELKVEYRESSRFECRFYQRDLHPEPAPPAPPAPLERSSVGSDMRKSVGERVLRGKKSISDMVKGGYQSFKTQLTTTEEGVRRGKGKTVLDLREGVEEPEAGVWEVVGLVFEVKIVRIQVLGMHGVQFNRIAGDAWEGICEKVLDGLKL